MSVATEHLPIFVASDERDLLNRISSFEEAACTFVSEVVKMQVFDFELATLASECCAYRPPTVRENSTSLVVSTEALLFDDGAGIVAGDIY